MLPGRGLFHGEGRGWWKRDLGTGGGALGVGGGFGVVGCGLGWWGVREAREGIGCLGSMGCFLMDGLFPDKWIPSPQERFFPEGLFPQERLFSWEYLFPQERLFP